MKFNIKVCKTKCFSTLICLVFFSHGIDDATRINNSIGTLCVNDIKCLGIWFWGNYSGSGLLVGLDDLEDLLQT